MATDMRASNVKRYRREHEDVYIDDCEDPDGDVVLYDAYAKIEALLTEARERITSKPWDDRTCLHARISIALGLPVEYDPAEYGLDLTRHDETHTL